MLETVLIGVAILFGLILLGTGALATWIIHDIWKQLSEDELKRDIEEANRSARTALRGSWNGRPHD